MKKLNNIIVFFFFCCWVNFLQAQSVIRGPYLQSTTSNSIILKWRTDVQTNGIVFYGLVPNELNDYELDLSLNEDHEIQLTDLIPDTVYYYGVGTTDGYLVGNTLDYFFRTAPVDGTAKEFTALLLGDLGTGDDDQFDVRDAYYALENTETEMVLMLGDNAYSDGEDDEYQENVFEVYHELFRRSSLWAVPGNHDYHACDEEQEIGPYFDIFTFPENGEVGGEASGTERYYSFNRGSVHFVMLDGDLPQGEQIDWLENDLAQNDQLWTVTAIHYPPYSKGGHDSDEEERMILVRENIVPILETNGVDLVFSGHSHSYERSVLLNGHYGFSDSLENSMILDAGDGRPDGDGAYRKYESAIGTVYTVAGTSGGKSSPDGELNHPIMYYSGDNPGYGLLEVTEFQLDFKFVNRYEETEDYFSIVKIPDNDNDGFFADVDCDDMNPAVNPAATEIMNNGIDEDCDGEDLVVGLQGELSSLAIKLYPDPVSDYLFLETEERGKYEIRVYNVSGRQMKVFEAEGTRVRLIVDYLARGLYILQVVNVRTGESRALKFEKL